MQLAKLTSPNLGSAAPKLNLLAGTHKMSAALTKITKDELNKVLEGWLCDCATTEEEWDVIAEYSFERKIKIVQRDYVGGVAQFLIDAFPEI
jgi:SRSO17 transposase